MCYLCWCWSILISADVSISISKRLIVVRGVIESSSVERSLGLEGSSVRLVYLTVSESRLRTILSVRKLFGHFSLEENLNIFFCIIISIY